MEALIHLVGECFARHGIEAVPPEVRGEHISPALPSVSETSSTAGTGETPIKGPAS